MENEQLVNEHWTKYELSEISLGDQRLNWCLLDSASKLAARPSVSINQACDDWADTKATYRLFANEKTTHAKILSPHQQRTQERPRRGVTVIWRGWQRLADISAAFLAFRPHPTYG